MRRSFGNMQYLLCLWHRTIGTHRAMVFCLYFPLSTLFQWVGSQVLAHAPLNLADKKNIESNKNICIDLKKVIKILFPFLTTPCLCETEFSSCTFNTCNQFFNICNQILHCIKCRNICESSSFSIKPDIREISKNVTQCCSSHFFLKIRFSLFILKYNGFIITIIT